jgi:hypothetical protein
MDIPVNQKNGEVFVQACRENDVKFLQSPEGQEMLTKALAHIKSQLPERDYSKPIPNMGVDAYTLITDLNKTIQDLTADRDEWKQQHENLLSVREADLQAITSLRQQLAEQTSSDCLVTILTDENIMNIASAVLDKDLIGNEENQSRLIQFARDAIEYAVRATYKPTEG